MPRTPIFTRPTLTKNAEFGVRDGTSQRLSFGPDGARGVRKIRVLWDQRYDAIRHFLGDNQIVYCDNVARSKMVSINRLTPLPWPDPQFGNLFANSVASITGHKVDGHVTYSATTNDGTVAAEYSHADIEIEYRPAPYVVLGDNQVANETQRFCSFSGFQTTSNYVTLRGGLLRYIRDTGVFTPPDTAPHGKPLDTTVGKVLPTTEFQMTWHAIPYDLYDPTANNVTAWAKRVWGDPDGTSDGYIGCVNSVQFLNFKPGTLLLTDVQPMVRINSYGQKAWDMVFTFVRDSRKWNFKYFSSRSTNRGWYLTGTGVGAGDSPSNFPWYEQTDLPDGYSIYNVKDFADLFTVVTDPTPGPDPWPCDE